MSDQSVVDAPSDVLAELDGTLERLAALDLTPLSDADCVRMLQRIETATRRLQAASLPVLREVTVRRAFSKVGFSSPSALYTRLMKLRPGAARRRVAAMDALTESLMPSGERIAPRLPETAKAMAEGAIDLDHVTTVMDVMAKIPGKIPAEQREDTEVALAELCRKYTPPEVERIGQGIVEYLDPDGTLADDSDRARHRGLHLGKQDRNRMSTLAGQLPPVTRALLEVMLTVWAAPGMNNPDDALWPSGAADDPVLDPKILQAAADNDARSQDQRNHDALEAALRYLIESGQLGKTHRGLPVQVIISMTKSQLEEALASATGQGDINQTLPVVPEQSPNPEHSEVDDEQSSVKRSEADEQGEDAVADGVGTDLLPLGGEGPVRPYGSGVVYTATGTVLSIAEAMKLAVRSDKSLAIFENHSHEVLYFGRARRLASQAQRLAMFAAHRGCSHPGCSNPALWAEAHHLWEWALGGYTDIDNEAPACPQHHRLIGPGAHQWQTIMLTDGPDAGRCAWIPPAFIDPDRTPMVNRAHHPDEALREARELMRAHRMVMLEQRKDEYGATEPEPHAGEASP